MMDVVQMLRATLQHGGPVVWVILGLSVLLYSRGFTLVVHLVQHRRALPARFGHRPDELARLRRERDALHDRFEHERSLLAAMVAAAPLLGLLGTVTGMIRTFSHLAAGGTAQVAGGLAEGISEALIATAAGLAVAIPGVLLVYAAHRQVQRTSRIIAHLENRALERASHV